MVRPTHVECSWPVVRVMQDEEQLAELVCLEPDPELLDLAGKFCSSVEAFDIAEALANGADCELLRSRAKELISGFRLKVHL